MSRRSTILTALLLSVIGVTTATSQDLPDRKNALTISVFPVLGRTLSLGYARKLKSSNELTFNARVRIAKDNPQPPSEFLSELFKNPPWYYDRYHLRTGLLLRLGDAFCYEPLADFGFGSFSRKKIVTHDGEGDSADTSILMDRRYVSAGMINQASWILDFDALRLKIFVGIGLHLKRYWETHYVLYSYRSANELKDPVHLAFYQGNVTVHGGLEFGLKW